MRSKAYSKVDNPSQHDSEDELEDEDVTSYNERVYNACCMCLWRWMEFQTRVSSLILYAYLYWYLIIMLTFGPAHMTTNALLRACLLASFLSMALVAISGDLCDIYAPLKLVRLWIIIFSVSSLSVVCEADVGCNLFSTTYTTYLIVSGIVGILIFGSLIHCLIVSKCKQNPNEHNTAQQSSDSTRHSDDSELSSLSPPRNIIQQYIDSDATD